MLRRPSHAQKMSERLCHKKKIERQYMKMCSIDPMHTQKSDEVAGDSSRTFVIQCGLKNMPATVILGAQWGDEGKGKLVDRLAEGASWVARFLSLIHI